MNTMTVKFFDGEKVTPWEDIVIIQFMERSTTGDVYVLTNSLGRRYTVYGTLICAEVPI